MNITILSVGKIKDKWFAAAQGEYEKRISRFAKLRIVELADEAAPKNASAKDIENLMKKEGERIIAAIPKETTLIVLTPEGKEMDSPDFAKLIGSYQDMGRSLTFVIGGSYGIDKAIKAMAAHRVSFSMMTFPHRLFRIMLVEQIYRAFKILGGEEYHK